MCHPYYVSLSMINNLKHINVGTNIPGSFTGACMGLCIQTASYRPVFIAHVVFMLFDRGLFLFDLAGIT